MENNKKLTLKVYRHKEEKDVFLLRTWGIGGGIVCTGRQDESTEFYRATTDIIEAVKNVYAENRTWESFENCMDRFNGKLYVWVTKKLDAEIDGYTGILEKKVKLYVRDFEKVLLTED